MLHLPNSQDQDHVLGSVEAPLIHPKKLAILGLCMQQIIAKKTVYQTTRDPTHQPQIYYFQLIH